MKAIIYGWEEPEIVRIVETTFQLEEAIENGIRQYCAKNQLKIIDFILGNEYTTLNEIIQDIIITDGNLELELWPTLDPPFIKVLSAEWA